MKDFHCDMLELRFDFAPEDIDENAFFESAGIENREDFIDEDGDLALGFTFDPEDTTIDYHAHLQVWVFKDGGSGRAIITFHNSPLESTIKNDPNLPHAEDFIQWLGVFFRTKKYTARINATYLFDDSFSPVITLPFPLVPTDKDKALVGGLVSGLSIAFQREDHLEMVIIQKVGDETFFSLSSASEINLADFDLSIQLRKLSSSVSPLIKKKEARDEKTNT